MNNSNGGTSREVRYERLRPQELIAEQQRVPVVYVPISPMEWHGLHLPFGVDMLHAYTIALETARETGGVVLPPLPLGTESVLEPDRVKDRGFKGNERIWGMDFPGLGFPSLYVEEHALGVIVHEIVRALKRQNYRVIVIVNGHGAVYHLGALIRIAVEETEPGKVAVLHSLAFDIGPGKGGHAERYETGFMLAHYPETVDLNALPPLPTPLSNIANGILDGPTCEGKPTPDYTVRLNQDPRTASVEEGNQDVKNGVQRIGNQVRQALKTWSDPNYSAWSPDRILGFDPGIFTNPRNQTVEENES
jgi:creatinine amidohydrolase